MNECRILISRLGWPSTSARWWSMQELATLLSQPVMRAETEHALLELLSSRKLEAEVVEILCIFWIAARAYGYLPTPKLAKVILKPSILSVLFLASLGLSNEGVGAVLQEMPEGFKIPEDFEGIQGIDLPRIFRTSMELLGKETQLPFVRQMAFEWSINRAFYPDAPFQGDLRHFRLHMREGFVPQLSSRTALRAISAYLRTLAVAEDFWGMPRDLAEEQALLALPIHPTLALLKPQRPTWFPATTDFDGDAEAIEASVRALIDRIQITRPGDELIAFSSPIFMSMERCVEVSIVLFSQALGSTIHDTNLAEHLKHFWSSGMMLGSQSPNPLSTTTLLELPDLDELMDDECKAWPHAMRLGLDRLGYLQHDLYPSRLYLPTLPTSQQAELSPHKGHLEIRIEEKIIADFCYWNAGWGTSRPVQFGGNCGTALTSRGTFYRENIRYKDQTPRSFYLWQVRTLNKDKTFDRFNQTLEVGVMFS